MTIRVPEGGDLDLLAALHGAVNPVTDDGGPEVRVEVHEVLAADVVPVVVVVRVLGRLVPPVDPPVVFALS